MKRIDSKELTAECELQVCPTSRRPAPASTGYYVHHRGFGKSRNPMRAHSVCQTSMVSWRVLWRTARPCTGTQTRPPCSFQRASRTSLSGIHHVLLLPHRCRRLLLAPLLCRAGRYLSYQCHVPARPFKAGMMSNTCRDDDPSSVRLTQPLVCVLQATGATRRAARFCL